MFSDDWAEISEKSSGKVGRLRRYPRCDQRGHREIKPKAASVVERPRLENLLKLQQ